MYFIDTKSILEYERSDGPVIATLNLPDLVMRSVKGVMSVGERKLSWVASLGDGFGDCNFRVIFVDALVPRAPNARKYYAQKSFYII